MANIISRSFGYKVEPWPVSPINESEVKVEASPNKFQAYYSRGLHVAPAEQLLRLFPLLLVLHLDQRPFSGLYTN